MLCMFVRISYNPAYVHLVHHQAIYGLSSGSNRGRAKKGNCQITTTFMNILAYFGMVDTLQIPIIQYELCKSESPNKSLYMKQQKLRLKP